MSPLYSQRHHRGCSVLLVDDVAETRRALAGLLRLRGLLVHEAADGETGLEALRRHPQIKVVVLDLVMRGTDGRSFREAQLREPAIADVPVLVFTAARHTELIRLSFRVTDVLHKPTAVGELLAAVAACCDEVRRSDGLQGAI